MTEDEEPKPTTRQAMWAILGVIIVFVVTFDAMLGWLGCGQAGP